MKPWFITACCLVVLLAGCQELLGPTPAPTPTLTISQVEQLPPVTVADLCGVVNQEGFQLGVTTEAQARDWLGQHVQSYQKRDEPPPVTYIWQDPQSSLAISFHNDKLLGLLRQDFTKPIHLGQIVDGLGPPEMVEGRLGWLTCEIGCTFSISLFYPQLGVIVDAYGVDYDTVEQNGVPVMKLRKNIVIMNVQCFVPNEMDEYYTYAYQDPIQLDPKYRNEWEGFGMSVPLPP